MFRRFSPNLDASSSGQVVVLVAWRKGQGERLPSRASDVCPVCTKSKDKPRAQRKTRRIESGAQGNFLGNDDYPQAWSWSLFPRLVAGQWNLKQRVVRSHSVPGNKTHGGCLVKVGERRGDRGVWGG